MQSLTKDLANAFKSLGADESCGALVLSNRPDLADYQCNGAFMAAKALKKSPQEIAKEVINKINNPLYDLKEVNGFINVCIKSQALLTEPSLQVSQNSKKVVIDFSSPNVAKGMHVGHLRSTLIGQALVNLYKFVGHEVTADNHLGDWGTPLGIVITLIKNENPMVLSLPIIEDLYIKGSKNYKTDPDFKQQVQETTTKLQEGEKETKLIWEKIVNITKEDLKKDYEKLNITFDTWLGESFFENLIEPMIEELENKGLAQSSQGAKVLPLDSHPPLILQKSSGGFLYHTTDLACLKYRQKNFDEVLYVVDKRQGLHFEQVFEAAHIAGYFPKKASHIAFGTINGSDGKPFKTRSGEVLKLKELILEVQEACLNKIKSLNNSYSDLELEQISQEVALGALKFAELKHHRLSDYNFDLDKFTSLEGFTGPYVLYAGVRMKSILNKVQGNPKIYLNKELSLEEKSLLVKIHQFKDYINKAYEDNEPHILCQYAYDLAKEFNSFYHKININQELNLEYKNHYLWVTQTSLKTLETILNLLGILIPNKM